MSNILTPGRLADRLQSKMDIDRSLSEKFGSELFSILIRELKKDDNFSIFGFGTFKKMFVEESAGRNPQTGESITIPSHYRIKFTPAGKLAERINAEYAHLKPVILEEEKVHEGLLLKAERYILSIPAEPEPAAAPAAEPETDQTVTVSAEEPDVYEEHQLSEPDFGFKKDRRTKGLKILLGIFLLLILTLGTIWILLKRDSGTPAQPRDITAIETENTEQLTSEEAQTTPLTPETPAPPEPVVPVTPGTSYRITPGDSFSILAKEKWGNIYLWPFIYSINRMNYPDPDLIRPGDSIMIPPQPDTNRDQIRIEDSILMAYTRYRELIREQAGSAKNPRRELSAGYVLVGGETLYPSFLTRNSKLIRPEDIRRAEELAP